MEKLLPLHICYTEVGKSFMKTDAWQSSVMPVKSDFEGKITFVMEEKSHKTQQAII